ncbi:GreA/GreB family elongation factor [Alloscardovia criceti]|uniref:GreA/GreB family elongation factor n=1 Tax=Alloscardovia criceti TaxID=356828 RepID=UPI00037E3491|nr:transcription elongation factor GreA [Alloscardovia criceti]
MADPEEKVIELTQEAYDKLKQELAWREGELRQDITEKIAAARAEGDLSENGGYQAAREAQGKNEGRINELIVKLRNAHIIEPVAEGEIGNGTVVTISLAGNEMTYLVGSREIAVASDYDVISPESPIGAAIFGHHEGETVEYTAPNGRKMAVEIKSAKPM